MRERQGVTLNDTWRRMLPTVRFSGMGAAAWARRRGWRVERRREW